MPNFDSISSTLTSHPISLQTTIMATYLITQATGKQSGSVIQHLLEAGASVHALVRDLQKIPPILERPGVKLFQGETENFDAVFRAAQGCKGVFLNTFPIPGLETQQARSAVDSCKKAGVETIVVSTTFFAGDKAMWDDAGTKEAGLHEYFASKHEVEEIVRGAGFKSHTILRPGFIHFDYLLPAVHYNYPGLALNGELDHAYNDDARMLHTAARDIGKYAAEALQTPAKFNGQEIELSNENLTVEEARAIVSDVSGRAVTSRKRTLAEIEEAKSTVFAQKFHLWANIKDFSAVANAVKEVQAKFDIPFTTLKAALESDRDALLKTMPTMA